MRTSAKERSQGRRLRRARLGEEVADADAGKAMLSAAMPKPANISSVSSISESAEGKARGRGMAVQEREPAIKGGALELVTALLDKEGDRTRGAGKGSTGSRPAVMTMTSAEPARSESTDAHRVQSPWRPADNHPWPHSPIGNARFLPRSSTPYAKL